MEWINVEDRLPERPEYDWVLVQVKMIPENYYGIPHVAELRSGKWYISHFDLPLEETCGVKVTHWMPLPGIPKTKTDEALELYMERLKSRKLEKLCMDPREFYEEIFKKEVTADAKNDMPELRVGMMVKISNSAYLYKITSVNHIMHVVRLEVVDKYMVLECVPRESIKEIYTGCPDAPFLLWERIEKRNPCAEPKEMTISQISRELGYSIKIVGDSNAT